MFDRLKINFLKKWWLSIDSTLFLLVFLIIALGNIFTAVASPVVANRIGATSDIFIIKNIIFSLVGAIIIITLSLLNKDQIKVVSIVGINLLLILMVLVLIFGSTNKGAKRWIYIGGFSLQPSEIIKPFFIVTVSYILTRFKKEENFNIIVASFVYIVLAILLIMQPDIGMLILMSSVFFSQLFLIGIDYKYFIAVGSIIVVSAVLLYFSFPHFHNRINVFMSSTFFGGEKSYQVEKSLLAFKNGGLLGKGPLEGSIKNYIPDAHTDFIFSVVGEEFGSIVCAIIIFIYFYIAFRIILEVMDNKDNFLFISACSLTIQFLLQTVINIGVTLSLLPTKGMTLPLISYGGSSMIGTSITIGFLLVLTKRSYGNLLSRTDELVVFKPDAKNEE